MLIMTQDRISGLASEKAPLSTYGPGNTRDESNRNSWVSSDGNDKLSINCIGQVNGLFLGRYQADSVKLTYQGDELFANRTSSGITAVGYANGSNGIITGQVESIEVIPSNYFYAVGTIVTISLNYDPTYINVNDIVQISGSGSNFDGLHRIVEVQQQTSYTKLNYFGNSVFSQSQVDIGNRIKVIVLDNKTTVDSYLSIGTSLNIENGVSIPIIGGLIFDEDDVNFNYSVKFSHSSSYLLKSGDSPFTKNEYISFSNVSIRSVSGNTVCENMDLSQNSYKSYYVNDADKDQVSFTVFVNPDIFLSSNLIYVLTTVSSTANFGSSFYYSGGGYQHKLGLDLLSSTSLSTGAEEFENNEVIELSSPSISSVSINAAELTLNSIDQAYLHKTYIKSRSDFSIRLPFKMTPFLFSGSDSIKLNKYIVDTDDAGTTTTGIGTPIRRIDIATRTQNTVGDFVTGKLIRVESNYIPLPREAFPSKIILEFSATLNHNSANLFNEFLLEEVTIENSSNSSSFKTITDSSEYLNYKTDVTSYLYNSNDDGELVLNMSSNTNIEEDDFIFLRWPNSVPAQNAQITKTVLSVTDSVRFRTTNPIHELYEGMKFNGTNGTYILAINTTTNEITTNVAHGLSVAGTAYFDHSPNLGSEAQNAWTGFHRVVSSENNGSLIKVIVPNAGTRGDLTINSSAQAKAATGVYVVKVSNGKGRFVRPVATGITQADAFLWNSDSTNNATYTYNSKSYTILPKTGLLIFGSPHSLVNNDKIILYNLSAASNASNLKGLKSSYLVTYTTSNKVTIELEEMKDVAISGLAGESANNNRLIVITSSDHGFSVGNKISLNNMPSSLNGEYTIETIPTSKSFTVITTTTIGANYNQAVPVGCQAITGVHNLVFGGSPSTSTASPILNFSCSRSISISDALSAFENPIEVGNLIYRDALQFSSSEYDAVNDANASFRKTPNIDDAASTSPYRSDSDSSIQNTFAGTSKSVVSQINLIVGDATSAYNIQLVKPFGILGEPFVFTKLLQSLRVAIVRAGVSRELPNPQVGVSNALKDFSVRKELPTGAYYYLNRASAKEFSGNIVSDPESVDLLVDFGAEQLARPFPCLVISGNKGNMKKLRTRTALYGYFTALPQATYSNKLVNLKEASFTIREVL